MTIEIHHPKYNGSNGRKEVGLAEWRLKLEGVITQVKITQTYKRGKLKDKLIYPTLYCMPTEKIIKYPSQIVGNNTRVFIVPLDDFKPKTFDLKEPQYYEKQPVHFEQGKLI